MSVRDPFPRLTPEEAAAFIRPDAVLGLSGFGAAGSPKALPRALAARALQAKATGTPMRLKLLTGASTGPDVDDALAAADAVAWRAPFQASKAMRDDINAGITAFVDMHLSHVPQMIEYGFFGALEFVVVEASEVTADGRVFLTTAGGLTPSLLRHAQHVIIERNRRLPARVSGLHDVVVLKRPPERRPVPIARPLDRVGVPFAVVDPGRILGVIETDLPDGMAPMGPAGDEAQRIAGHIARFLVEEHRSGRLSPVGLPFQAGVGNLSDAVMRALGASELPPFEMYTEVLQDSVVDLMRQGRCTGASTCALYLTDPAMASVAAELDFFEPRIVIRPQEISNNPSIIRQLGVVSLNTVLEVDLYGCANSTHVCGTQIMNGIGGSGDFVRNAALNILMTPSVAKKGAITSIVPMVSHVDHNEHSTQIVVTEQGVADLRGKGPMDRARLLIENCAHPEWRDWLRRYVAAAPQGHLRHDLGRCFELHRALLEHGTMKAAL